MLGSDSMENKLHTLIEFLKSKGIDNPENPDSNQMKDIISLYLQTEMTTEQFKLYFQLADPAVNSVMKGLTECITSNKCISEKVIELIQTTIAHLNEQIKFAETIEERREIRKEIEKCIIHAREEAKRNSDDTNRLYLIGAGAGVVLIGVGVAVFTKNQEVLKKGMM
jgi:hypothetical protein